MAVRESPRRQPGAYIHDGKHLYEVMQHEPSKQQLILQDCETDALRQVAAWQVLVSPWELARAAPQVPSTPQI